MNLSLSYLFKRFFKGSFTLNLSALAIQIHQISSKFVCGEVLGHLLLGQLNMLLVEFDLFSFILTVRIEKFVCSALQMIYHDYLSKLTLKYSNRWKSYPSFIWSRRAWPMRILLLRESKTWSCQYEAIIVVVVSEIIHEIGRVVDKAEVHTIHNKAFSCFSCFLILSRYWFFLHLNFDYNRTEKHQY